MSAGDPWANDAEPSEGGWGCWPRLALLATVLGAVVALAACPKADTDVPTIVAPPAPTTGQMPAAPNTGVLASAVRIVELATGGTP